MHGMYVKNSWVGLACLLIRSRLERHHGVDQRPAVDSPSNLACLVIKKWCKTTKDFGTYSNKGQAVDTPKSLTFLLIKEWLETHQGVLQVWVSVRYRAPSWYSILSTPRLVPMAWPPSTPMRLANKPDSCALSIPGRKKRHQYPC
jgi:hypothetical protein